MLIIGVYLLLFMVNNSKTHKLYVISYKNYLQTSLYL